MKAVTLEHFWYTRWVVKFGQFASVFSSGYTTYTPDYEHFAQVVFERTVSDQNLINWKFYRDYREFSKRTLQEFGELTKIYKWEF